MTETETQQRIDELLQRADAVETNTNALVENNSVKDRDEDLGLGILALLACARSAIADAEESESVEAQQAEITSADINIEAAESILKRIAKSSIVSKLDADVDRITHFETRPRIH